ncbi:alpha/beta-type small acid-soluble spore protein, partial [Clostridium butyricum]
MSSYNSNKTLVPEAKAGLNKFKTEVASELGLQNYAEGYKGDLSSKQNGSVGGEMVK